MAINTGDNIEATHYTDALSRAVGVLGNGVGQSGYGQVMVTPEAYFSVSANDELIAADHWNKLQDDINTGIRHQTGLTNITSPRLAGRVIGDNETFVEVIPQHSVAVIQVLTPGVNVTSVNISIAAPTGPNPVTAQAVANISNSVVSSITVTNVGAGYELTPAITVSGTYDEAPVLRVVLGAPYGTDGTGTNNLAGVLDLYSELTQLETDEANIGAGQFTLTSDRSFTSSTRFSPWGGDGDTDDTIFCELDIVFDGGYDVTSPSGATVQASGEDHRRHFFNTGGEVRLSFTSTDNNDKDANWNAMFNSIGSVVFGKNATTVTGSGLARDGATDVDGNASIDSAVGNFQLTTGYQTIFRKFGSDVYSANYVEVQVKRIGTDTIRFIIYFNDFSEGNPNFDERVLIDGGTQVAGIDLKRATGSCAVPEPTPSVQTEFQNT